MKKTFNRLYMSLLIILICNIVSGQQANNNGSAGGKQFRASVVKINITPGNSQNLLGYGARKSTGVHDSIYHRIVALDDGTPSFFLFRQKYALFRLLNMTGSQKRSTASLA